MQTGDETKLCTQTPAGRRGDMSAMGPRLTELIDRHAVLTVYSATHDTAAAEARGSCPTVKRPVCMLCQQLHKQYHEFIMDVLSTHGTTPGFPPGRSCRLISPREASDMPCLALPAYLINCIITNMASLRYI